MSNKNRTNIVILILCICVIILYCLTHINITKAETYTESVKMYVGIKKTLKVYTDETITWKSSNTSVATVNSKGRVTPKKCGTVTITATTSEDTYKHLVTVYVYRTEDEVKELLSGTLSGTVKQVSKSVFSSNPITRVDQLKDARIGDYLCLDGTLYIIVNKTDYRLAVYDGTTKFNISYNRLRAVGNFKVYTRY